MEKQTIILNREKETPGAVRFKEEEQPGKAPVIGTLYVKKYAAGNAASVKVTLEQVA